MMTNLEDLFTKYGTDKGIWGYTPAYEKHLEPLRGHAKAVLEIGICGFRDIPNNVVGASLFAWKDYFPKAEIYGLDNDSRFIFHDQHRIKTELADAYDHYQLISAMMTMNAPADFDFICDDAVHDPAPQMRLFDMLWPHVAAGGKYAIEEACPYKVPDHDLFEHMVKPLMLRHETIVGCEEVKTHKDERLLIFTKA